MTTLERVRAKIVEAVPEIMELKFGCRIEYLPKQHIGVYLGLGENPKVIAFPWGVQTIEENFLKPLGRPITLADVLRAMPLETMEFNKLSPNIIRMTPEGMMSTRVKGYGFWNLAANLDDQSPEVHEFLGKILDV